MPSVTITGAAELEAALKDLGPKPARKYGKGALKEGGEVIADYARMLAPVDTGKLEESITVVIEAGSDDEVKGVIGFKKPRSSIAHLLEFGSSKMSAQPFIRPAIAARGEAAIAVIGAALWEGIEKEARKAKK